MKVITAPTDYIMKPDEISVFLAGGITNCPDWQEDVITELGSYNDTDKLVIFNPRRDNFPIDKPTDATEQIEWEFTQLENMDIFSMYFSAGKSDQPICMYELGRNIVRMQTRFPMDWEDRIIISAERDYKRLQDVIIQTNLACGNKINVNVQISKDVLVDYHTSNIIKAYKIIKRRYR